MNENDKEYNHNINYENKSHADAWLFPQLLDVFCNTSCLPLYEIYKSVPENFLNAVRQVNSVNFWIAG